LLSIVKPAAFGLLLGLLGIIANVNDEVLKLEEHVGLGMLFKLRGAVKAPADAIVVSIDRVSSDELKLSDNPDRWPRALHARLVETLRRAGARVIVFDLYFVEPRAPQDDDALAEAIKSAGNVVLAEPLKTKEIAATDDADSETNGHLIVETLKPIEPLLLTAFGTAPFVLPRMPVRVSQYWTFQTDAGDTPTFPVLALQLYTLDAYQEFQKLMEQAIPEKAALMPRDARSAIASIGAAKFIRDLRKSVRNNLVDRPEALGQAVRAPGANHQHMGALVNLYTGANRQYLNFYGPPRSLTTVPYFQALQLGNDPTNNKIDLRGKAVFIGLSENLLAERKDSFHTVFSTPKGIFISGVEIAATAFLNLLTNTTIKPARPDYQILTLLGWGLLVGVLCRMATPLSAGLGIIFCSAAYLFFAHYQFRTNATWFPIVIPLFLQAPIGYISGLMWNYFEINKQRKRITEALGYYVPEEVVRHVARNMLDIRRYGDTVYGACLFADVAGYTPVSEGMTPRELSDLMHKYLEATFEQIHKQGGLVVELKGDSILAIWKGIPGDAVFRRKACEGALGMAEAVRRFNQSTDAAIKLPTRISVHIGPLFLGNIGAGAHYEYGVTGDTATTASRLDGLNKHLGTNVLVSDEVIRNLDGFISREIGTFLMKGKTQPIVAHELICRTADCTERQKEACAVFTEARQGFARRNWDEAEDKFARSDGLFSGDGTSRFYLKLCTQYRSNPPPEGWSGTITMDEK